MNDVRKTLASPALIALSMFLGSACFTSDAGCTVHECDTNADCGSGRTCSDEFIGARCVLGRACETHADCSENATCEAAVVPADHPFERDQELGSHCTCPGPESGFVGSCDPLADPAPTTTSSTSSFATSATSTGTPSSTSATTTGNGGAGGEPASGGGGSAGAASGGGGGGGATGGGGASAGAGGLGGNGGAL